MKCTGTGLNVCVLCIYQQLMKIYEIMKNRKANTTSLYIAGMSRVFLDVLMKKLSHQRRLHR